jgi:hypothetical protein
MSVLLFLNELSFADPHPKEQVNEAMKKLVGLLRRIAKVRDGAALVSDARRDELELAPGYFLAEWAGQASNLELWRSFRRMRDKAPYQGMLPLGAGDGVEYRWNDRLANGLGAAHLMDGMLVSLLVDDCWDTTSVRAVRSTLVDDHAGQIVVADDEVQVRHAAAPDHLDAHHKWLRSVGIPELQLGAEIWEARTDLFPNLQFLSRTEDQFTELRREWVKPAARELRRIDDAIADWDPEIRTFPTWRSYITPEGEQRKKLCRFIDQDGQTRLFDLHGRFTPDEGRIHFRLIPEERKARVAHVGLKLGI